MEISTIPGSINGSPRLWGGHVCRSWTERRETRCSNAQRNLGQGWLLSPRIAMAGGGVAAGGSGGKEELRCRAQNTVDRAC
eukprot:1160789-Pelagomonas_calceolata.AAC.4